MSLMNNKNLGVIFRPTFAPETLPAYAKKAEAAGFDELWLWDDCFLPGGLTSAAVALSATEQIKVGIGLIPSVAYNPLFTAMELTTLACNFPGRILPGIGHGVASWMKQIGAKPKSSLAAIEETTTAVRRLLQGEEFSMHGKQVNLEKVKMDITPEVVPPFFIGGMRTKTLGLAGRVGDGAILPAYSSPAYVRWTREQIDNPDTKLVVYAAAFVDPDAALARRMMRNVLAKWLPWGDIQLEILGIADEVKTAIEKYGEHLAEEIPDAWLDELTAAGSPEQVKSYVERLYEAGADSVVLEPDANSPEMLDGYVDYLLPVMK